MTKKKPPRSADELLRRYKTGERDFTGASLPGADLNDAELSGAILRNASFQGAQLRGAYLAGADLEGVDFGDSDLTGANLVVAKLFDASFERAILKDTILWFARLSGANFIDADLTSARLENAFLGTLDLRSSSSRWESKSAKGLTQEQIDVAMGNEYTVLPKGFERPASWGSEAKPYPSGEAHTESYSPDQPRLILWFKEKTHPKTLEELSLTMAAWTDYLKRVALLNNDDPTAPISDRQQGALVLAIMPTLKVLSTFGEIWLAVLAYRRMCEMEKWDESRGDKAKDRLRKKMKQEMIESTVSELKKESKKDKETVRHLFNAFLVFAEKGGEAKLEVPAHLLKENDDLVNLLSNIREYEK